jgi:hypothetical protein
MKSVNVTNMMKLQRIKQSAQLSKSPAVIREHLLDYIVASFPDVYAKKTFWERVAGEMQRHHRYLQLATASSGRVGDDLRVLAGVQLLTLQTVLMFLLAVFYNIHAPSDDGSCSTYTTSASCLARSTYFDSTQPMCSYDDSIEICSYRPPVFTWQVILIIGIIVSVLTAALYFPFVQLFHLLASPVADKSGIGGMDADPNTDGHVANGDLAASGMSDSGGNTRLLGTKVRSVPASVAMAQQVATASSSLLAAAVNDSRARKEQITMRMAGVNYRHNDDDVSREGGAGGGDDDDSTVEPTPSTQSRRQTFSNAYSFPRRSSLSSPQSPPASSGRNSSAAASHTAMGRFSPAPARLVQANAQELLQRLLDDINCQRRLLKQSELEGFDWQWGMDPTGEFVAVPNYRTNGGSLRSRGGRVPSGVPRADVVMKEELQYVLAETAREISRLQHAPSADVGVELLQLFVQDLLGRDTPAALVFKNKALQDFKYTRVVHRGTKLAAWVAIIGINIFFVYYSILLGFERGLGWQRGFMIGCIFQLLIEVFVVETIECLFIHFMIPVMIADEVQRVSNVLRDAVQKLCSFEKDDARYFLNVPGYLYVSSNVAKRFPDTVESIIIRTYQTHLPGEIAHRWRGDNSTSVAAKIKVRFVWYSWIVGAMVASVVDGLKFMGATPLILQQLCIRLLQPCFFVAITYLIYAISCNPAYLFILVLPPAVYMLLRTTGAVLSHAHRHAQADTTVVNSLDTNAGRGPGRNPLVKSAPMTSVMPHDPSTEGEDPHVAITSPRSDTDDLFRPAASAASASSAVMTPAVVPKSTSAKKLAPSATTSVSRSAGTLEPRRTVVSGGAAVASKGRGTAGPPSKPTGVSMVVQSHNHPGRANGSDSEDGDDDSLGEDSEDCVSDLNISLDSGEER